MRYSNNESQTCLVIEPCSGHFLQITRAVAVNLISTWSKENGAPFEEKAYAQEHKRHKEEVQNQTQNKGPGPDSRRLEVSAV